MSSTLLPNAGLDVQGADQVVDDLACAECGYNLRTLAYSGNCPECGLPVIISARGDRLADAPANWLKKIQSGAWLLRLSVILAFPFIYPGVALSCLGIWRLTEAQPGRTEPASDRGYRLAARWTLIISAIMILTMIFFGLFTVILTDQRLLGDWSLKLKPSLTGWRTHPGGMQDFPLFDLLFLTGHALYLLSLPTSWRYLRILAERAADTELADAWLSLSRCWLGCIFATGGIGLLIYLPNYLGIRLPHLIREIQNVTELMLFLAVVILLVSLWVATMRVAGRQLRMMRALGAKK